MTYLWTTPTKGHEIELPGEMVKALALVDKHFPGAKCLTYRAKENGFKKRRP